MSSLPVFDVTVRFLMNVDGWARGDEVTVARTPDVCRMIDKGLVAVVSDHTPTTPGAGASRAQWARFMEEMGRPVHPQATRRMLMDQWEGVERRG